MTLFVGIGGGMDIFGCLPLYFETSCNKIVANLTFVSKSRLVEACKTPQVTQIHPWVFKINPQQSKKKSGISNDEYFPEQRLASYLNHPVYAILPFDKNTVSDKKDPRIIELSEFFCTLLAEEEVTSIYYVDGGCDALLKGNELGLGTPTEDMFTLKVFETAIALQTRRRTCNRFLVSVGLDLDIADGVLLQDLDTRLTELIPVEIRTLSEKDESVQKYVHAVLTCNPEHSIIHSMVVGAIRGLRGFQVPNWLKTRLKKSRVALTDRLSQLFIYRIHDVLNTNVYWKGIQETFTCKQLDKYICNHHERAYFANVIVGLLHDASLDQLCWDYWGSDLITI